MKRAPGHKGKNTRVVSEEVGDCVLCCYRLEKQKLSQKKEILKK